MCNGTITRRLSRVVASAFVLLFGTVAHAVIPPGERDVLLRLYAATNGAGWTTSTNWNGAVGTECSWYGIVCSNNATVLEINLLDNNLTGSLPALAALANLQVFDVSKDRQFNRTKCQPIRLSRVDATEPPGRWDGCAPLWGRLSVVRG